jgi:hypothetical protein
MPNFTKRYLDTLAAETGFIRDNLEKVLRLCEVLHYIEVPGISCVWPEPSSGKSHVLQVAG